MKLYVSLRGVLLLCPALLLSFALTASAQNLGTIVGTLTDRSGGAIPNAEVRLTHQGTGLLRVFQTNEAGTYVAPGLLAGAYTVEVTVSGFRGFKQTDLILNIRETVRLDIQLELGQVAETVEVTAALERLQTENATVSDIVTGRQVQSLSMNARNFLSLASLVPGASSTQPAFNIPVGVSSNASISFNGTRASHNVWRVDGQENYDRGCGGCITVLPNIDAIQEFKVGTANSEVDTGFGAAGQINVSIKSGTKDFHGTAYEFLRNDHLDASNFFANLGGNPKPHLRYNTFGYNIGGPVMIPGIYKKGEPRTFFFWAQDWRRLRQGTQFFVPAIPAAQREGDFSGYSGTITDPTTGQAFPDNRIPASRIDQNARLLLDPNLVFPLPTTADNFYSKSYATPTDVREEILRVDHNIADKHQVFFRFIFDTVSQNFATTMWTGSSYPTVGTLFTNPPKVYHWQVTSTFSPRVVNEASVSYAKQPLRLDPTGNFQRPSGLNIPELYPDNRMGRLPNINLAGPALGVNINMGSWPWDNASKTWFWRDNVTMNRGNHTITFGGTYMHFVKFQDLFGATNGAFTFNGTYTGHEVADMLLGRAFQYDELSEQYGPNYITHSIGLYVNDTWRITPKLTMNYGLRWDGLPHAYEEQDRVASFYIDRYDPAQAPQVLRNGQIVPGTGNRINGMGLAGKDGVPRGMVDNHWNLFMPRMGLAWRPVGDNTVFRIGYGIYHERIQGNDIYNVAPNPPFVTNSQIFDAALSNPGGGTAAIFPPGLTVYDPSYKIPQIQQYNAGIQHRLAPGFVAQVAYVGTKGSSLQSTRNINQPFPDGAAKVLAGTHGVQQVRPFLGYGNINMYFNGTNSIYNSLQTSVRADGLRGLNLQLSYTWAKAIDQVSGDVPGNSHQDSYNARLERGLSGFDRRHMFVLNYVYDLPFFRGSQGIVRTLAGGWQVSGITSFQTGTPLNISLPGDNAGIGGGPYRPDILKNPNIGGGPRERYFDPGAFAQPARGLFGNAPRNAVTSGGVNNWDLSIFKNFPAIFGRESTSLQFRTELYNAFNHTQWTGYRTAFGAAGFGSAISARDARSIQLGLKLYW